MRTGAGRTKDRLAHGRIQLACLAVLFASMTQGCSGDPSGNAATEFVGRTAEQKMMVVLFERDRAGSSEEQALLGVVQGVEPLELDRLVVFLPHSSESPAIDAVIELYGAPPALGRALESLGADLGGTYEIHAYCG